jgi:hypothetical protein
MGVILHKLVNTDIKMSMYDRRRHRKSISIIVLGVLQLIRNASSGQGEAVGYGPANVAHVRPVGYGPEDMVRNSRVYHPACGAYAETGCWPHAHV